MGDRSHGGHRGTVTGDQLAARVAAGLGRRVVYRSQPLDEFERDVDAAMGAGTGRRVASKFRFFASHRHQADAMLAGPFEARPGLEDFRPTQIEQWVRRHLKDFHDADGMAATEDS